MKNKINSTFNLIIGLISLIIFPLKINGYIDVASFIDFSIFIDPGHGGKDNGANHLSIYEDEINLSIASYLYEICLNKNLFAFISRTGDYDLASYYSKNRKNEDLIKRVENIAHSGVNCFISLHVNYYEDERINGPMVYYEKNDKYSYLLAEKVQKELNVISKKNKKILSENFYLFRKCEIVGVLVETGFISNEEERAKLLDENYQKAIAEAIFQGIYNYYLAI